MKKMAKGVVFDSQELQKDLARSAKAIGVSKGAADTIVTNIAKRVTERVKRRPVVTEGELNRFIAEEAERYSKDLAYVYRNRGKII